MQSELDRGREDLTAIMKQKLELVDEVEHYRIRLDNSMSINVDLKKVTTSIGT
jgi:hypothetical protein